MHRGVRPRQFSKLFLESFCVIALPEQDLAFNPCRQMRRDLSFNPIRIDTFWRDNQHGVYALLLMQRRRRVYRQFGFPRPHFQEEGKILRGPRVFKNLALVVIRLCFKLVGHLSLAQLTYQIICEYAGKRQGANRSLTHDNEPRDNAYERRHPV
jgi:hypothetical protein